MEISQVGFIFSFHFVSPSTWNHWLTWNCGMSYDSTPSTHAHSAEKTPLEEQLSVSGTARDAERQLPVVLGPSLLLPLLLSEGELDFFHPSRSTILRSRTDFGRCDV